MMTKNLGWLATPLLTLIAPPAHAEWALNMTQGITAVSRSVYGLHMLAFWICVWIGVFVFGWMIYSIVVFRHSKGAVPDTKLVHNTKAEIIWTTIPVLILIGLAVPAAKTLIETDDASNSRADDPGHRLPVEVGLRIRRHGVTVLSTLDEKSNAARQLGSGIDPFTVDHYLLNVDHPLVVPAGVKVRLLITAQDVIHSWWLPVLAIKKDAIPGFVNEAWFKIDAGTVGTYRGQCAELCGRDHGFMPIVVEVKSKDDFEAWIKGQQAANAAAAAAAAAPAATPTAAAPAAAPAKAS